MDDKAALIARRVAMSAAAWFNAPRMSRPIDRRRAAAAPFRAAARRDSSHAAAGSPPSSSGAWAVAVRVGPLQVCYATTVR